ncbi:MAG: ABC transporter permease subunit [Proteobacteria bacterium]|nr:ABC transporter permease subunit [Pseudomonadota bacterium]
MAKDPDQLDAREAQLNSTSVLDMTSPRLKFRRKLRHFYDRAAKVAIGIGGIGVIVAILLIFLYLFYEVIPLFKAASVAEVNQYQLEVAEMAPGLHLAIEEQSEIGMRLDQSGTFLFFNLEDGTTVSAIPVSLPEATTITAFTLDTEASGIVALGLSNGQVVIVAYGYETSYAQIDNVRTITPVVSYPFGTEPYQLFSGQEVIALALRTRGESMLLAGSNSAGQGSLVRVSKQTNLLAAFSRGGEARSFDTTVATIPMSVDGTTQMYIEGDQRWLYFIAANGLIRILDMSAALNNAASQFEIETFLTVDGARPTRIAFMLGGISLLVADDRGIVSQWFLIREGDRTRLQRVRDFTPSTSPIVALSPEQRRKNFVVADATGAVSIYNSTAHREVFSEQLLTSKPDAMAISPRGDALLIESAGNIGFWRVANEHPEVSWTALWDKVWYESYTEPEYIWQSSAATNEFEPKYSLVPLSFGTLKAAFYAMLFAAPLAICGAIFTGYFMAPGMRRKVKPLIELMEALPTVVLGFLAGLWLAPFVEKNLLGIFSIIIILPVSILLASFVWMQLLHNWRHRIPEGWEAGMLIPVILVFGYLSFALATPVEQIFFEGDLRFWISNDLGITYDQRNALVVGFAMGFAVIPTIFTIAEDAIFTVPKHLTYGSLALGANPWQSLYRVVLPTASPGIFSALMIGMGRAVGETMIVLMATGNTPIMDINIFEGMRTLAANIAVEIPESEVDSTHYRILFLAALVLFTFTFVFNTVAEIVRQRLRRKYSTI